jgi:lysophospholipase L1-like esterase
MLKTDPTIASTFKDRDQLTGEQLKSFGRIEVKGKQLELIGSAVHFGISFEGKECIVLASVSEWQDHNYIQYELDGVYQKRLKINKGGVNALVIKAATEGKHILWVYKATEAQTGPVFIHKLQANNIKALPIPTGPLIEFIGNSITCGAASDPSEVPCGKGEYHDQHNAYLAYGPRLARALGANFILSSVSGYGMYRNWNSEGPTLPQVYNKLDLQGNSSRQWSSGAYSPDIISIALGTNDFSSGDGKTPRAAFDSVAFISSYVSFVKRIKEFHPSAHLVLLTSPTVSNLNDEIFRACIIGVKNQIDSAFPQHKPVELFFFKSMQVNGCTGHPDIKDHEVMALNLFPSFRKLVK